MIAQNGGRYYNNLQKYYKQDKYHVLKNTYHSFISQFEVFFKKAWFSA